MKTINNAKLIAIGTICSPYKIQSDAPFQGGSKLSEIEIFEEYKEGLEDIESFSHLHIFYWLHKSKDWSLLVHTPWDANSHGLFTTRTPNRPNPIGYAVVELIERDDNILKVKGLDAIEGTPIIDIKPYIESIDTKQKTSSGWIEKTKLAGK